MTLSAIVTCSYNNGNAISSIRRLNILMENRVNSCIKIEITWNLKVHRTSEMDFFFMKCKKKSHWTSELSVYFFDCIAEWKNMETLWHNHCKCMMYDECDIVLAFMQLHGDFESIKSNQKCLVCAQNYHWLYWIASNKLSVERASSRKEILDKTAGTRT